MNDMTNIFEIKPQHYWDFEATNLSPHYCQPTQMAVCRPDAKSNGQLKTREIAIRIPSVEKINDLLGIKAKIDLEEGILKTAEWIKNNLE